ncbi:MAG TPA: response regulator transcription factor [Bacteroidales bacterium]|nr:response regulator transcription factor [Bacteroidales bacterium]HOU95198.1 response regulator transcription factor [Bacteroidales bacterium]HQG35965.1 response regulator transcription factor [Bacteroidales bacterium]HQG52971.1 response regulator transcription factor [Bacteroidales bacterium]HQJ20804.1 response regulator transcription factor [Bacteroidales bacterium]
MNRIKIIIVDDHQLFRNGLRLLLEANPEYEIIGEASNGQEFLNIISKTDPDIVLMDINMPELDGIEATKQALKIKPDLNIIALSMYGEEEYYYKMTDAGAHGFLLKNSDISEVHEAINTVYKGGSYFSQELLHNVIQKIKHRETETKAARLSKREKEILLKICEGLSNQEIADTLFISKRTVDKHRANLLAKTNSKNTASLILYAIKNKIIEI